MRAQPVLWILVALSAFMFGCAGLQSSANAPVGCQDFSLRKGCVNREYSPLAGPVYSQQQPFTSQRLPRSYPGAPPQIPHSIEGLTLNREGNSCLSCHFPGGGPVPGLPNSHLKEPIVVLSRTSRPATTQVHGFRRLKGDFDRSRYFCVQCHVPQAGNLKPLVQNNF